jgi:hypothetical protein
VAPVAPVAPIGPGVLSFLQPAILIKTAKSISGNMCLICLIKGTLNKIIYGFLREEKE